MAGKFAEAVSRAFREGALVQEGLYLKIECAESAISHWKSGKNTPSPDLFERFLAYVEDPDLKHALRWAWNEDVTPPDVWAELAALRAKRAGQSVVAARAEGVARTLTSEVEQVAFPALLRILENDGWLCLPLMKSASAILEVAVRKSG